MSAIKVTKTQELAALVGPAWFAATGNKCTKQGMKNLSGLFRYLEEVTGSTCDGRVLNTESFNELDMEDKLLLRALYVIDYSEEEQWFVLTRFGHKVLELVNRRWKMGALRVQANSLSKQAASTANELESDIGTLDKLNKATPIFNSIEEIKAYDFCAEGALSKVAVDAMLKFIKTL